MAPATRKKRVSKKNKKSWRKNTDVSDVDAFLEEIRKDEREGGAISTKPDDVLFQIDTVSTKKGTLDPSIRLRTKKERRQNPKPLQCFETLRNKSCVPDPVPQRDRVYNPGERPTISFARRKQEQLKFLHKHALGKQDRSKAERKRAEVKISKEAVSKDLWAEEEYITATWRFHASHLAELAEGLPIPGQETKEEAMDSSDSEYKALNPPVKNRKKTRQQRRRLNEAHIEMLKKQADKVERKKISDIYQLRKLQADMAAEAAKLEELRALREKMKQYKAAETKQMSRFKFEQPVPDFNMPGDLSGNIRNIKVEGSLLVTQFKSLQKRNIIETRVRQKRTRKYKLKKFTKASHKTDLDME
ncbi:hypothetical protein B566_EDAN008903 [Ephemera danica]|nr:hypothetical protein B566_EDAN008903 [Ephemera danica]